MQVRRSSNGEIIHLDKVLGTGGEGTVYGILKYPSWVAKIYHPQKITLEHSYKLKVMFENPIQDASVVNGNPAIAWPLDLLMTTDENQRIVGFLMYRVNRTRPIHDFYAPKARRQEMPSFTYLGLHRIARNLAIAVSKLHERGYIIGDLNESNILVDPDTALVTLVDTDSFQVKDTNRGIVYRCPVGKPEFTPPELQGISFRDCDRTPDHDLFGLAVLIFQLLMEGTHPFDGVFQEQGEVPAIASRISTGHFPYGNHLVPYLPKPLAPDFKLLHPNLRQSFQKCFQEGHRDSRARLTAQSWVKALSEAEAALVECSVNSQHRYGSHSNGCLWCMRTKQLNGIDPFPSITPRQKSLNSSQPVTTLANGHQAQRQMASSVSMCLTSAHALRKKIQPIALNSINSLRKRTQPTVRSVVAIFWKPHILIGTGLTLTISASLVYMSRLNESKMMTFFYQVELLKNKGEFKACIEKARDFPEESHLYTSVMGISDQCHLSLIKELGRNQDFKTALLELRQISQDDPLFNQSQQLIIQFINEAIELATQNYESGDLEKAIKIVEDISQIYVISDASKGLPERWREEWYKNSSLMSSLENAQSKDEWKSIITMSSQVTTKHWSDSSQKIVDKAYAKLAQQSLYAGRWDEAIKQANNVVNRTGESFKLAMWILQQAQIKKSQEKQQIAQSSTTNSVPVQDAGQIDEVSAQSKVSSSDTSDPTLNVDQERVVTSEPIISPEVLNVPLVSEVGVDYTKLRTLLAKGKWLEADWETKLVMHKAVNEPLWNIWQSGNLKGIFSEKFPCRDFQTIDQLWLKASKGRFGFSVQWHIMQDIAGVEDLSRDTLSNDHVGKFGEQVGWTERGGVYLGLREFILTLDNAPVGQFPTGRWREGSLDESNSIGTVDGFVELDYKFHQCGTE